MDKQKQEEKPVSDRFKCQQCGACCRQVGKLIEHLPLVYGALFAPDESGACRFLKKGEDGKYSCDIYNIRPPICNVQWVTENSGLLMDMDEKAVAEMTEKACEELRKLVGT